MKTFRVIILLLFAIITNSNAQYDFNAFVNKFKVKALPLDNFRSLINKSDSIDAKTLSYFVMFNLKIGENGERPKTFWNNELKEDEGFGTIPSSPTTMVNDNDTTYFYTKAYPICRLSLNPNFISVVVKVFSEETSFYDLYNFTQDGKCLSAVSLSYYQNKDLFTDVVGFIFSDSKIDIDGAINRRLSDFEGNETFNTFKLRDDGYFAITNQYSRYPANLNSVCDSTSENYDPNSCAQTICDRSHSNFDSIKCAQATCNATSPNYDAFACVNQVVTASYDFDDLSGSNLTLQDGATITDGKLVLGGGDPWSLTHPHVTVPNSPALNPQYITVASKIKFGEFVGCGNDAIVNKPFTSHSYPYYQYHLGVVGSYPTNGYDHTFSFAGSISGQYDGLNSYPVKWIPGEWYTVVAVYDGANIKLYVNGVLAASKAHAGTLDSFNTDMFIGKFGNIDYAIPAELEWVKVFNRALSDAEVSALGGK